MNTVIRKNRETVNLLLVIALFFNAFSPFSVVLNQFWQDDTSAIETLFGDKILICTPFGYKYVSLDELDETDMGHDEIPDTNSHCSLCMITMDHEKLYLVDFTSLIELEILEAKSTYILIRSILKSVADFSIASPRAPPFSF